MADEMVLTLRIVPLSDDDLDAACEAVANGARSFVLAEVPNADPLTLEFRLSPEAPRG